MKMLALVLAGVLAAMPAVAGTLTLDHDKLTQRLRSEIPSGAITYKDGRVVIRGTARRFGLGWPFAIDAYFTRASGRTRLTAESLSVGGRKRDDLLAQADAKLALLVDELPADKVEIMRGGKLAFEQVLP